jgi:hypothetical protein
MIAFKLANLISDFKDNHSDKVLFKKQLEVSVLNTTLENQTVTKVLRMANKLFAS